MLIGTLQPHCMHEPRVVCYIMSNLWPSSPLPWPAVNQLPATCQIDEWGFWPLTEGKNRSQSSQNQQKNCPTEHSQIANPQNWPQGWMVDATDPFISTFFLFSTYKTRRTLLLLLDYKSLMSYLFLAESIAILSWLVRENFVVLTAVVFIPRACFQDNWFTVDKSVYKI